MIRIVLVVVVVLTFVASVGYLLSLSLTVADKKRPVKSVGVETLSSYSGAQLLSLLNSRSFTLDSATAQAARQLLYKYAGEHQMLVRTNGLDYQLVADPVTYTLDGVRAYALY